MSEKYQNQEKHSPETPKSRRWWEDNSEKIVSVEYDFKKKFGTKENVQEAMLNDIKSLLADIKMGGVNSIDCGEDLFMSRENPYYGLSGDDWGENASEVLTVFFENGGNASMPLPDVVKISPIFGNSPYEPETLTIFINTELIREKAGVCARAFKEADKRDENY